MSRNIKQTRTHQAEQQQIGAAESENPPRAAARARTFSKCVSIQAEKNLVRSSTNENTFKVWTATHGNRASSRQRSQLMRRSHTHRVAIISAAVVRCCRRAFSAH